MHRPLALCALLSIAACDPLPQPEPDDSTTGVTGPATTGSGASTTSATTSGATTESSVSTTGEPCMQLPCDSGWCPEGALCITVDACLDLESGAAMCAPPCDCVTDAECGALLHCSGGACVDAQGAAPKCAG